jgi:hypothetical protein
MKLHIDTEQADLETKVHDLYISMQENLKKQEDITKQLILLGHESNAIAREIGVWEERLNFAKFNQQDSKQIGLIRATR